MSIKKCTRFVPEPGNLGLRSWAKVTWIAENQAPIHTLVDELLLSDSLLELNLRQ